MPRAAPPAATTAAWVRNPRRDGLSGSADVLVGGVLRRVSARVMMGRILWLGLEPGRKFALPLGLLLWYQGLWRGQVWYQRKSAALLRREKVFKSASDGAPPSSPRLMLGSQRLATKP